MYKIGYEELRIFFMNANNCIYTWRNALDIIRLRMELIVNNENFKGKAATGVKAYLSDVHIYLIDSIITLLDEYAVKFIMYQNGLYQFDSSETASLDEGEMNDLRDIFNSALTDITDLQEACVTKMNGISDLTDCNLSSLESYTAYLTDSRTELVDYRNAIEEYDNSYAWGPLSGLKEILTTLLNVVDNLRLTRTVDATTYEYSQQISEENREKISVYVDGSKKYFEENSDAIMEAYEQQQVIYERHYEELSEERIHQGVQQLVGGGLGVWAWVSSGSLSPAIPVVGIPFMLCGISDIMVGAQDMYFGFNNDISTESYDPLLFMFNGNEEMYHYFELVSTGAFVVAGSIYTFNNVMYQYSYGIPTYYNTTGPSVFVGNTIMEGYTDLGVTLICADLGVDDEYAFYISASTGMIVGNVLNTNLLTGNNPDLSYNYVVGAGGNSFNGRLYNGIRNPSVDFVNGKGKSTLGIHATKHGYASTEAYLNDARYFLEKQPTSTTQSFVSRDGTYFRYDTATNEFGIINKYGGISTYFKPEEGMTYWLEQIEKYAPK